MAFDSQINEQPVTPSYLPVHINSMPYAPVPQMVVVHIAPPPRPDRLRDNAACAFVFLVLGFFFSPAWCAGFWFSSSDKKCTRFLGVIMLTFGLTVILLTLIGSALAAMFIYAVSQSIMIQ